MTKRFNLPNPFPLMLALRIGGHITQELSLTQEKKEILGVYLEEVLTSMAEHIIKPALLETIATAYPEEADPDAPSGMTTMTHNRALQLLSKHFADAILPELQKPEVINNETIFVATLTEIAEGLSAASKEEILAATEPTIREIFDPSKAESMSSVETLRNAALQEMAKPLVPPRYAPVFDALTSATPDLNTISLVFDANKLKLPRGLATTNDKLTAMAAFKKQAIEATKLFLDTSATATHSAVRDDTTTLAILLGFQDEAYETIADACNAINEALTQHKEAKATGKTR